QHKIQCCYESFKTVNSATVLAFIKVVKSCFHPDKVLFFENPEADASGSRSALYSAACGNGIVQGIFKEGVQVGKSDK
ncbi:hypothetical protein, partial [Enterocloster clostridioformis]